MCPQPLVSIYPEPHPWPKPQRPNHRSVSIKALRRTPPLPYASHNTLSSIILVFWSYHDTPWHAIEVELMLCAYLRPNQLNRKACQILVCRSRNKWWLLAHTIPLLVITRPRLTDILILPSKLRQRIAKIVGYSTTRNLRRLLFQPLARQPANCFLFL